MPYYRDFACSLCYSSPQIDYVELIVLMWLVPQYTCLCEERELGETAKMMMMMISKLCIWQGYLRHMTKINECMCVYTIVLSYLNQDIDNPELRISLTNLLLCKLGIKETIVAISSQCADVLLFSGGVSEEDEVLFSCFVYQLSSWIDCIIDRCTGKLFICFMDIICSLCWIFSPK